MDNICQVNMDNQLLEVLIQPVYLLLKRIMTPMSMTLVNLLRKQSRVRLWLEGKNLNWGGQHLKTSWMHRNFPMERHCLANIAGTKVHIKTSFVSSNPYEELQAFCKLDELYC